MNEVAIICNQLQQNSSAKRDVAKTIYAFCRSVTPQFYKHTAEEMNAAVTSIQMLIVNIREDVLAKMCELAVKSYPAARAKNSALYFDINYILQFYREAWETARPKEFSFLCAIQQWDRGHRIGYCRVDDFDIEHNCVKDGAEIWWDER